MGLASRVQGWVGGSKMSPPQRPGPSCPLLYPGGHLGVFRVQPIHRLPRACPFPQCLPSKAKVAGVGAKPSGSKCSANSWGCWRRAMSPPALVRVSMAGWCVLGDAGGPESLCAGSGRGRGVYMWQLHSGEAELCVCCHCPGTVALLADCSLWKGPDPCLPPNPGSEMCRPASG